MINVMEWEYKSGQMELNMKVSGVTIKLMDKGNSGILMVIFMKVNERMIKQKVMECISIKMGLDMKGTGRGIFKMALE